MRVVRKHGLRLDSAGSLRYSSASRELNHADGDERQTVRGEKMTSERKRIANTRNAEKSMGPRTSAGKAISSRNAIKHGLLSRDVLAPNEDAGAFEALRDGVVKELSPDGKLEEVLAERIAAGFWRLERLSRVEADLFLDDILSSELNAASAKAASYENTRSLFDLPSMTETTITDEEEYEKAQQVQAAAASKRAETVLGQTFARKATEGDVFSKLARYETSIERGILRWLRELQRLQETRSRSAEGSQLQ